MARPPRYNADYFTHESDLRNDRKVKALRTKFGAAGYGIFHMLLEALTDADHTQLDTSELEIELLAGDFGVSATEIHSLLQFAESVGYFTRNEAGLLICPELNKWLEPVFEKRNRSRNTAKPELLEQPAAETGVSVTENPQSKVKESKVKESIEDTTSSFQSEVVNPDLEVLTEAQKKIEELEREVTTLKASSAQAPHTEGARRPAKQKAPAIAFADSPYADVQAVIEALKGTDYEYADARYYHEAIRNWAEGKGEKKVDWLATIRGAMLRDSKENKLKTTANTQQVHGNVYGNHNNQQGGGYRNAQPNGRLNVEEAISLARNIAVGVDAAQRGEEAPGRHDGSAASYSNSRPSALSYKIS